MGGSDEGKGQVPAVDRTVRILTLLAGRRDGGLGVSDISRRLGLNKSTAHAILLTLCEHGLLERDPGTLRYRPGTGLHALAGSLRREPSITVLARPALDSLLDEFDETVFLAVLQDGHITLLDKAESPLEMSITSPLGHRLPRSAGALGKVFHAFMTVEELRLLLRSKPLRRFTGGTIVNRKAYLEELHRVRAAGIAYDDEEYMEGVRAAAVPVFDERGVVVAALCVVGPSARLGRDRLRSVGEQARELARSISTRLGAGVAPVPDNAVR